MTVIDDLTQILSGTDVAETDRLLALAAQDLRAAPRCKDQARKRDAHLRVFREDSGNAALSGRELDVTEVLASWQHIQQRALDLRAAGIGGTLRELRVMATMDLRQKRDRRTAPAAAERDDAQDRDRENDGGTDHGGWPDDDGAGGGAGLAARPDIVIPWDAFVGDTGLAEIPGSG